MKIGIPKEIKNNENRVGMTPAGVSELVKHGHTVYVQHTAGEGSGFSDDMYSEVGAQVLPTIEDVYATADMIIKVKEPIAPEYGLVRKGQLVFTYFHFACSRELTDAMLKSGGVCLAYETVQPADGSLPLLTPMSEIAGRMATINGAYYLQKTKGGMGKLICGVPGVRPAKVVVLGGGIVGQASARVAAGMGADVVITDISLPKLHELSINMPANVNTVYSSHNNICKEIKDADIVIGAVIGQPILGILFHGVLTERDLQIGILFLHPRLFLESVKHLLRPLIAVAEVADIHFKRFGVIRIDLLAAGKRCKRCARKQCSDCNRNRFLHNISSL